MKRCILLVTVVLSALLSGCSAHNERPLTPAVVGTTPTYRSTARSTDLYLGPYYTQPGVNGGTPASLPVIPSQDRWDPNDPVATQVYTALTTTDNVHPEFLRVYARKGIIWLQGSVRTRAECDRAAQLARGTHGVTTVRNDLRVQQSRNANTTAGFTLINRISILCLEFDKQIEIA